MAGLAVAGLAFGVLVALWLRERPVIHAVTDLGRGHAVYRAGPAWLRPLFVGPLGRLLDRVDPNVRDYFDRTVLHQAAIADRADVVRELIARGAEVNARDNSGRTPLHFAAIKNRTADAILLLLGGGARASIDVVDWSSPPPPLTCVALADGPEGTAAKAEALLAAGAPVDARHGSGATALAHAAAGGDLPLARVLLAHGADPNALAGLDSILQWVVGWRYQGPSDARTKMVQLLLAGGADAKRSDRYASVLFRAAAWTDAEGVKALLDRGADPNDAPEGIMPALAAVLQRDGSEAEIVHLVDLMLQRGADPRAVFQNNQTLLHLAVKHRRPLAAAGLIAAGADVAAINASGDTPRGLAERNNDAALVELLAKHAARQ